MKMKKVIRLDDGTRYIADTAMDIRVWDEPGKDTPKSASDLYAHRTKRHGYQFYLRHWSTWENGYHGIEAISRKQAEQFLDQECSGLDEDGFQVLQKLGMAEETA